MTAGREHTKTECASCGQQLADGASLCASCAHRLERALASVTAIVDLAPPQPGERMGRRPSTAFDTPAGERGALLAELRTTAVRQNVTGSRSGGSRPAERPLPQNSRAFEALRDLQRAVAVWALHVGNVRGIDITPPDTTGLAGPVCRWRGCGHPSCERRRPPLTVGALAGWLLGHVEWIRHRPPTEALAILTEIAGAAEKAERLVDRPADRWYAGPCLAPLHVECGCVCHGHGAYPPPCDMPGGCGATHTAGQCQGELYSRPDAQVVVCPQCGTEHSVPERRAWLLAAAEDHLATAIELSRALPTLLERPLSPKTIRTWEANGRLARHGQLAGPPLYRVGDVIELAMTTPVRNRAKQESA